MLYYWMREAIALINPKVFIAENVKGLVSLGDAKEIIAKDFRDINSGYVVVDPKVLHAADYGVPQNRERVFFIGIRKDLLSQEEINCLESGQDVYPSPSHNFLKSDFVPVKDYLLDLSEPSKSKDPSQQKYSKAKFYGSHCQGHREIDLEGIAPTIRSEHHGNIEFRRLSKENGGSGVEPRKKERRLSVRECARIQTFPDDYVFVSEQLGASEAYKLIGNAVPPLLGYHIAHKVRQILESLDTKENA